MRSLLWMLFWAMVLFLAGAGCKTQTHLHVESLACPAFVVKRIDFTHSMELDDVRTR
jgi:hypothetical protein